VSPLSPGGEERFPDGGCLRAEDDQAFVHGKPLHEVHDPRKERPALHGKEELGAPHPSSLPRGEHDPGHRLRSAARSTASTTCSYPVHRHRFPDRCSRTSSAVGEGFSARRAWAAMINPGVQNPH